MNTIGALYDNFGYLITEQNGYTPAGSSNFRIRRYLTANTTYYVQVREANEKSGPFKLLVTEKQLIDSISITPSTLVFNKVGAVYELPTRPNTFLNVEGTKALNDISLTVTPGTVENKRVLWSSLTGNVISIDYGWSNGERYYTMTIVGEGTAKLIATDPDGNGKRGECTVYVNGSQTASYDVEEGATYSLALVNENAVELVGDNSEVAAVMTLSNTAVYSVEESDDKSEGDQSQGESGNIGSVGTYEVDVATGLLNVEMKGFAWEGNRMPISFAHTFKSLNRTEQYGGLMGWRINLLATMLRSVDGENTYEYTDENGQITVFHKKESPCGMQYESENGDIYDTSTGILEMGGEQYKFNSYGLLQSVTDQNNNKKQFEYDDSQIEDPDSPDAYKEVRNASLTDGANREFKFEYFDDKMTVSAPNEACITYNHDAGGPIEEIIYPNGQTVAFTYYNNLITSIKVTHN